MYYTHSPSIELGHINIIICRLFVLSIQKQANNIMLLISYIIMLLTLIWVIFQLKVPGY